MFVLCSPMEYSKQIQSIVQVRKSALPKINKLSMYMMQKSDWLLILL